MKYTLFLLLSLVFLNGCTQVITAPIKVVGAVAETAIDVGAAGVRAVTGGDDD